MSIKQFLLSIGKTSSHIQIIPPFPCCNEVFSITEYNEYGDEIKNQMIMENYTMEEQEGE